MADQYVRKFFKTDPVFGNEQWKPATELPRPLSGWETSDINKILEAGKSRFFRSLKLCVPISCIVTALASAVLIWLLWDIKASPREMLNRGFDLTVLWFEKSMPWFGESWTEGVLPVGILLLLFVVALLLVKALPALSTTLRERWWHGYRGYLLVTKLLRSFRGNVLWLLGWFPILFSLVVAVFSTLNYVFYYLPFKWHTRNKP
jgi:hypothetical protein